jgi:hypothetical protein
MYRQYIESANLSLEQGTENVPDDGLYYVIFDGNIVFSHKSFKEAAKNFNSLKADYVQELNKNKRKVNSKELISKEVSYKTTYAKEQYWGSSHMFRKGKPKR